MFDRLLPRRADNSYPGHGLALGLFALLAALKLAMGLNILFNAESVARKADGIPLDSYGPDGARAVLAFFTVWGLEQFVLGALSLAVLVRYRALVPFLFVLLLVEHVARRLIFDQLPIARAGTAPGGIVNLVLFWLMVAGLALSLWRRRRPEAAE